MFCPVLYTNVHELKTVAEVISQRFYLSMCDLLTDGVLFCRVYAFGMAKDSDLGFPAFFGLEVVHATISTFVFIITHAILLLFQFCKMLDWLLANSHLS